MILTDDEIADLKRDYAGHGTCDLIWWEAVRVIEAAFIAKLGDPVAWIIDGGKHNGRLLHEYEYKLNTDPQLERWKVCAKPLYRLPEIKP